MDFDSELSVIFCVDVLELISLDVAVVEGYTVHDLVEIFLSDRFVQDYLIYLLLVVRRMCKSFSDFTVVCKHEYAGGVLVQTTYREYSGFAVLQQVHDRLVCVRIARCGNESLRFVHYDINLLFSSETLAVESYVIGKNVHFASEFGNHFTIYGNYTGLDVLVSLTA